MRGSGFCCYFITIKRLWHKCVSAPGDYILFNMIFKLVFSEQRPHTAGEKPSFTRQLP